MAPRRLYRGQAGPADRFIGLPCGCVMIAKNYTNYPEDVLVQADEFYSHVAGPMFASPELTAMDCVVSSTYHYGPVNRGEEGIPWQ